MVTSSLEPESLSTPVFCLTIADAMAWMESLEKVVLAAPLPLGLLFLTAEDVHPSCGLIVHAFHGGSSFAQGTGPHIHVSCNTDLPPELAFQLPG